MIKSHGTIFLDNIDISFCCRPFWSQLSWKPYKGNLEMEDHINSPQKLENTTSRNETSLYTNMSKTIKLFYKHALGQYMANNPKKGRLHTNAQQIIQAAHSMSVQTPCQKNDPIASTTKNHPIRLQKSLLWTWMQALKPTLALTLARPTRGSRLAKFTKKMPAQISLLAVKYLKLV